MPFARHHLLILALTPPALVVLVGCQLKTDNKVEVAPIEVKPIQITVDVNIRIQQQLNDFFDFQKPVGPAVVIPQSTTAPAPPTP